MLVKLCSKYTFFLTLHWDNKWMIWWTQQQPQSNSPWGSAMSPVFTFSQSSGLENLHPSLKHARVLKPIRHSCVQVGRQRGTRSGAVLSAYLLRCVDSARPLFKTQEIKSPWLTFATITLSRNTVFFYVANDWDVLPKHISDNWWREKCIFCVIQRWYAYLFISCSSLKNMRSRCNLIIMWTDLWTQTPTDGKRTPQERRLPALTQPQPPPGPVLPSPFVARG